ncbi:MAG: segregation/condensation protein A [Planctomycetes bacterium]|nr:segregation/condensation protein A [Planctomycetota bacterium]
MNAATVRLESFTGPLDLLLHLVRENEVDIHDIPLARIAEQYLKLIEDVRKLDIEVASEFLVMAAVLAEMKARQLLPNSIPIDDEDLPEEEEEDPKIDLIRQLLRFRFFKERAGLIERLMHKRSLMQARPENTLEHIRRPMDDGEDETFEVSPFILAAIIKRYREEISEYGRRPIVYDDIPVEEKIEEILSALSSKGRVLFHEIIRDATNPMEVVTAFLAILELVKQHLASVRQIEDMNTIVVMRPDEAPPANHELAIPTPAQGSIEIVRQETDDPLLNELSEGLLSAHRAVKRLEELHKTMLPDEQESDTEPAEPADGAGEADGDAATAGDWDGSHTDPATCAPACDAPPAIQEEDGQAADNPPPDNTEQAAQDAF